MTGCRWVKGKRRRRATPAFSFFLPYIYCVVLPNGVRDLVFIVCECLFPHSEGSNVQCKRAFISISNGFGFSLRLQWQIYNLPVMFTFCPIYWVVTRNDNQLFIRIAFFGITFLAYIFQLVFVFSHHPKIGNTLSIRDRNWYANARISQSMIWDCCHI